MAYQSDNGGDSYNLCHCALLLYPVNPSTIFAYNARDFPTVWSNFEIASMDFWRGEAYSKYFEALDNTGGFYYEVRAPFSFDPHKLIY